MLFFGHVDDGTQWEALAIATGDADVQHAVEITGCKQPLQGAVRLTGAYAGAQESDVKPSPEAAGCLQFEIDGGNDKNPHR